MSKPELGQRSATHQTASQDVTRVTQTMYTQSLALNEKIHTLSILQAIDSIIIEGNRDLLTLGKDIARAITASSKFAAVSIYSRDDTTSEWVAFKGTSLHERVYTQERTERLESLLAESRVDLHSTWAQSGIRFQIAGLQSPESLAISGCPPHKLAELHGVCYEQIGLQSLYVSKMIVHDTIVGLLYIGLEEPAPHLDDIELAERISQTAGIALYNRLLQQENEKHLHDLKASNEKLQAIDASKDEFIAMASHQLRTPLTSMKGYVSMMLEGDFGPISDEQRVALERSYSSAQHMVYVLSDLLNVSRLKNGKFVIVNNPTNLVQMVEEEFNQLKETADKKHLTLKLDIHGTIPKMLLDENKMRQVVMNFLDNAIYYTPANGLVTINLSAHADHVTYTVTDTGLGVPAKEQVRLFEKFFRASNAKRVRPDGTGLGLFMAAKVIHAQGGEIIFFSKEGSGSTFGFRLPIHLSQPAADTTGS